MADVKIDGHRFATLVRAKLPSIVGDHGSCGGSQADAMISMCLDDGQSSGVGRVANVFTVPSLAYICTT